MAPPRSADAASGRGEQGAAEVLVEGIALVGDHRLLHLLQLLANRETERVGAAVAQFDQAQERAGAAFARVPERPPGRPRTSPVLT